MVVEALGLDGVDAGRGRQRLEGEGDPGDQAASRHRREQHVGPLADRLELAGGLQPHRPLAGDDVEIVEGGDHHRPPLRGDGGGDRLARFAVAVVGDHLGPERPRRLGLHRRRVGRHDDQRRAADQPRRQGHALGMVSRGEGDHPADPLFGGKARQAIVGAAELERAGALQGLALDEHPASRRSVDGVAAQQRGRDRMAAQPAGGVLHILERRKRAHLRAAADRGTGRPA